MLRSCRKFHVLSLVLVAGLSAGLNESRAYELAPADTPVRLSKDTQILKQISDGVSAIYESSKQALVFVSVSKTVRGVPPGFVDPFDFFGFGRPNGGPPSAPPKQEGLGSGFIIDLNKGYVITNNHVIEGADEIMLKLANEQSYAAKILGRDPNTDVAVVQIIDEKFDRKGLSSLVLGDSDRILSGSLVLALGAPFGLEASASLGIVSATSRGNLEITQLGNFVQTDAAINPGNSGGPLIDMDGKVMAINTAIFSRSGAYNGIGFGVPSNLVRTVATSLINEGTVSHGFIGVEFAPLRPDWLADLNLPKGTTGVVVTRLSEDGPAEKAGIKPSDVIVAIDGKAIKDYKDLVNAIGLMGPGKKTILTIFREGKKQNVELAVTARPGAEVVQNRRGGQQQKAGNSFGLVVEEAKGRKGLVIKGVEPRSPAELEGLQVGDIIIGVNGRTDLASNKKTFQDFLGDVQNSVLLLVERHAQGPRGEKRVERYLVRLEKR